MCICKGMHYFHKNASNNQYTQLYLAQYSYKGFPFTILTIFLLLLLLKCFPQILCKRFFKNNSTDIHHCFIDNCIVSGYFWYRFIFKFEVFCDENYVQYFFYVLICIFLLMHRLKRHR